jgi:hypothetical protein
MATIRKIGRQDCPTPIGLRNPFEHTHLSKDWPPNRIKALVDLERIMIGMHLISKLLLNPSDSGQIPTPTTHKCLSLSGHHIQGDDIWQSVTVQIGNVIPHRGITRVGKQLTGDFLKRAIFLVNVEVIVFMKIIAYVDVWPTIQIDVRNRKSKPVT